MKLKRLILLIASMMILPVWSAFAQDPAKPDPHGNTGNGPQHCEQGMLPGAMMPPVMPLPDNSELAGILQQVGVNPDATKKILDINKDFTKTFSVKIISVQREDLNLRSELLKDHPDLSAVKEILTRKSKVFSEIEFAQIKRDLDIKDLLSPDQFDKWKSITMQKMHDRFGEFHRHQTLQ